MNLTIPRRDLTKLLSAASRALPKNGALPVINNLYLDITGSELIVKATNLEVEVVSKLSYDATGALSVLLPPNFVPVINSLSSTDVELKFDMNGENGKVEIMGGSSTFTLFVKDVEDYPVIVEESPVREPLLFTSKLLREILGQAIVCVSADENRPVFQSVVFCFNNDNLEVISSDTYRLSYRVERGMGWGLEAIRLVPGRSIKELIRLLGTNDEDEIEVFPVDDKVVFRSNSFYFSARVVTQKFPDIVGIVPGCHEAQVVVPARELESLLTRVALIVEGENHPIRVKLDAAQGLEFYAESQMGCVVEPLLPVCQEGADVEVYVNVLFFLDAVKAVSGENVRVCFNGPTGPVVFYDDAFEDWLCLILPIKMS